MNFLKKLEKISLIAWLFLLPWQTRLFIAPGNLNGDYWEYATISLYALDILLIAIIILHLINRHSLGLKNFLKKQTLFLILILGLVIANLVHSLNFELSIFHFIWLALGFLILVIIRQNILPKKIVMISFITGVSIACLLGTWQFINQTAPEVKWLGLAMHDSTELGTSVVETIAPDGRPERWLRAYGPLDHPNMLGGLAALSLLLLIYFIWQYRGQLNEKEKVFSMVATIALTTGLITSFSRAAWLTLLIGILIYLISIGKRNIKTFILKLLPTAIIIIVIAALFALPYYYIFIPRFSVSSRLENISVTERLSGTQEAMTVISKNFIIGSGLGTYSLALTKEKPEESVWFYQPVHNTFLLVAAEIGLVGLILIIWLIILLIRFSWRNVEKRPLVLAMLAGLIVIMFFDHWLMSLHFGVFVSAAILGLITAKPDFDSTT